MSLQTSSCFGREEVDGIGFEPGLSEAMFLHVLHCSINHLPAVGSPPQNVPARPYWGVTGLFHTGRLRFSAFTAMKSQSRARIPGTHRTPRRTPMQQRDDNPSKQPFWGFLKQYFGASPLTRLSRKGSVSLEVWSRLERFHGSAKTLER